MTALIALASALVFGGSDFAAGVATRRDNAFRVTAAAQIWSALTAVVLALVVTSTDITGADVVGGVLAGLSGTFTFICFYRALSLGAMSVIAPTTGLVAAVVPATVGIARGEHLAPLTLTGIGLAVVAIFLVAHQSADRDGRAATPVGALVLAAVAGLGFAAFLLALELTKEAAGMWPLVIARAVSVPVVCVLAVALGGGIAPRDRNAHRLAILAGLTEMIANGLILVAVRRGPIAVASVFGALYPVSTGLLAWILLRERISRSQLVGVGLAVVALVLVAA